MSEFGSSLRGCFIVYLLLLHPQGCWITSLRRGRCHREPLSVWQPPNLRQNVESFCRLQIFANLGRSISSKSVDAGYLLASCRFPTGQGFTFWWAGVDWLSGRFWQLLFETGVIQQPTRRVLSSGVGCLLWTGSTAICIDGAGDGRSKLGYFEQLVSGFGRAALKISRPGGHGKLGVVSPSLCNICRFRKAHNVRHTFWS